MGPSPFEGILRDETTLRCCACTTEAQGTRPRGSIRKAVLIVVLQGEYLSCRVGSL